MSTALISDSCFLMDLAAGKVMHVLRDLGADFYWTAAVHDECVDHLSDPGMEDLVLAFDYLQDPLRIETVQEATIVKSARDDLRGPADGPRSHLGESESFAVAQCRFSGPVLIITEDQAAHDWARSYKLRTARTSTILKAAYQAKVLDDTEVYNAFVAMNSLRRFRWPGADTHYLAITEWLGVGKHNP